MRLKKLKLENFRCHNLLELNIPDTPFYISGSNGAGKTAVIEALYLAFTLKTFRRAQVKEIVRFNAPYLKAVVQTGDKEIVYFFDGTRKLLVNGAEESAGTSFEFPVVCYSPSFETILSEEKGERRTFLDRVVYYTDKSHLEAVKTYNALLQRKRAELLNIKPDKEVLAVLNSRLAPLSDRISTARLALVKWLNRELLIDPLYELIMQGTLPYFSVNRMREELDEEVRAGKALFGCHRDNLFLKDGEGKIFDKFPSFGQRKSIILFILTHIAKRIEQIRKTGIMLLLDDFEAGLDTGRINLLATLFLNKSDYERQTVLTGVNAGSSDYYRAGYTL